MEGILSFQPFKKIWSLHFKVMIHVHVLSKTQATPEQRSHSDPTASKKMQIAEVRAVRSQASPQQHNGIASRRCGIA